MKKNKLFFLLFFLFSSLSLQSKAAEEESYTHVHIIDYDHPLSFEEIKTRYTAYDAIDGNLTDQLQFISSYEADYTNNSLAVKTYLLEVSITNSRNVTVQWIDEISVRDFTAPTLSCDQEEITIDIATENIEEILIQSLTIKDNWDTSFSDYNIKGLEEANNGPGTYHFRCSVMDSSGNMSNEVTITTHILKTFEKQISFNTLYIENAVLSESELLALFLQQNAIDTAYKTAKVTSSYFKTPNKEGIYQVEFIFDYENETQKIYQCKIINTCIEEKKKDDKIIYISLMSIFIIIVVEIIIYKKRR